MTVTYDRLDSSYPNEQAPCGDGWENQCAIRMSIALEGAGFSFDGYTDPLCSHNHARGAESLANHLWRQWGRPRIFTSPQSAKGSLASSRGIIFFKDLRGFRGGSGDHIDLWSGTRTKTGEYFSSCKQVWFYSIT